MLKVNVEVVSKSPHQVCIKVNPEDSVAESLAALARLQAYARIEVFVDPKAPEDAALAGWIHKGIEFVLTPESLAKLRNAVEQVRSLREGAIEVKAERPVGSL